MVSTRLQLWLRTARAAAAALVVLGLNFGGTATAQTAAVGLKMIVVPTEAEALDIRSRLIAGEYFEELARLHSLDSSARRGGRLGPVIASELREEFQQALAGLSRGQVSPVARLDGRFALLQIMTEGEMRWNQELESALEFKGRGLHEAAEEAFISSLAEAEAFGPAHPLLARSLNNLASFYHELGNHAAAEPLYLRALGMWESAFGPAHPDVAATVNNLALLYQDQGNDEQAELLYLRALPLMEDAFGATHPNVGISLSNLAALYRDQGRYEEAEPLYLRALAIQETNLGETHPELARSLNNLASFYRERHATAAAEPLYLRALAILEQSLGPTHPEVALSLNNLAAFYREVGDAAAAETLQRRIRSDSRNTP